MRYIILLFVVLTACEGDLTGGEVVDKEFHPSWNSYETHCVHHSKGGQTCIPIQVHHDATFKVLLEWCQENKDKCVRVHKDITEHEYDMAIVGSWYGSPHPRYEPPPSAGVVMLWVVLILGTVFSIAAVWYFFSGRRRLR